MAQLPRRFPAKGTFFRLQPGVIFRLTSPAVLDTIGGMDMSFDDLSRQADDRLENTRPANRTLHKLRYTHEAMIDLIIANPGISQNQLAATFGFTACWVSNILASDAFQMQLSKRRAELVDPAITATIEERFKGLVIQSLDVLQRKLEKPAVSDTVALKALELGAKALGVGGNAPAPIIPVDLSNLRDRLLGLRGEVYAQPERVIEGEVLKEEKRDGQSAQGN